MVGDTATLMTFVGPSFVQAPNRLIVKIAMLTIRINFKVNWTPVGDERCFILTRNRLKKPPEGGFRMQ